ncbi:MAG: MarR family transcriptional regulator [Flavobacteriaceae bacterium]|nr:MarR family transcriptional regulator [Flavobacteriaceae bacterium]
MNKIYFNTLLELITTGHWLTDSVSRELKEYDIYEPQFNVLRILKGAKGTPISVNTILSRMIQKSSNVTRIIDKLVSKGLVERKLCPKDRRKMDIILTEKGEDLLIILNKKVEAFHNQMENNLNKKELENLQSLIIKLKGDNK